MASPAWPPPITSTSRGVARGPGAHRAGSGWRATLKLNIMPLSVVLGDVAVRHPQPGIGDVQQDVDGLARAQQHGVLPHQVRLRLAVPGQDEEPAGAVDVERVVHRVVGVHLVDQPDLHPVTDGERPADGAVHRPGLAGR